MSETVLENDMIEKVTEETTEQEVVAADTETEVEEKVKKTRKARLPRRTDAFVQLIGEPDFNIKTDKDGKQIGRITHEQIVYNALYELNAHVAPVQNAKVIELLEDNPIIQGAASSAADNFFYHRNSFITKGILVESDNADGTNNPVEEKPAKSEKK